MQEKIDSDTMARYWDDQAPTFDDEPDHGLRDPVVRRAWSELLLPLLPDNSASVIDLGCGTGTLALLMAEQGHRVQGLDLSARMVAAATRKAARSDEISTGSGSVEFTQGDAGDPPYPDAAADVVLVRHVLWAMPDADQAVARWARLLKPDGMIILVEGRWATGGGIAADDCLTVVKRNGLSAELRRLDAPDLWGHAITDDRYLVVGRRA